MSEWYWQDRAACRGDLQFTEREGFEQAATCRRCPVRFECREFGLAQKPSSPALTVVYGGLMPEQLVEESRVRRRAGDVVPMVHRARCVQCGSGFESLSAKARYCSKGCRQSAYVRRRTFEVHRALDVLAEYQPVQS